MDNHKVRSLWQLEQWPWRQHLPCGRQRWIRWCHQQCSQQYDECHRLRRGCIVQWRRLRCESQIGPCCRRWWHHWLSRCTSIVGGHRIRRSWRQLLVRLIRKGWRQLVILQQLRSEQRRRRTVKENNLVILIAGILKMLRNSLWTCLVDDWIGLLGRMELEDWISECCLQGLLY